MGAKFIGKINNRMRDQDNCDTDFKSIFDLIIEIIARYGGNQNFSYHKNNALFWNLSNLYYYLLSSVGGIH